MECFLFFLCSRLVITNLIFAAMKNICVLLVLIFFSLTVTGQDSLKTEIVFKTVGNKPFKVYLLQKEKYIFYGRSSFESDNLPDDRYYPREGISYEREYLLTAPNSAFLPNNKEISFVVMEEQGSLHTRFTTTTNGKKQEWNLVPTGKNYKLGSTTLLLGLSGMLVSGVLFALEGQRQFSYKQEMDQYHTQSKFLAGMVLINPGMAPALPHDKRKGFTVPVITSAISLTAIVAGLNTMFRNSPRVERVE